MASLISDPILVETELKKAATSQESLENVTKLYALHYPTVRQLENSMEKFYTEYRNILAPVTTEIFDRASQGKILIGDDFIDGFYLRTRWMLETSRKIRQAYEREYRAASNLMKMM